MCLLKFRIKQVFPRQHLTLFFHTIMSVNEASGYTLEITNRLVLTCTLQHHRLYVFLVRTSTMSVRIHTKLIGLMFGCTTSAPNDICEPPSSSRRSRWWGTKSKCKANAAATCADVKVENTEEKRQQYFVYIHTGNVKSETFRMTQEEEMKGIEDESESLEKNGSWYRE